MKINLASRILGVLFLLCVPGWAQSQYSFKTYTAPAGGRDLEITGINNAGIMVGDYTLNAIPCCESRGIMIYPKGIVPIRVPLAGGGFVNTFPGSINNHNEVNGSVVLSGRFRGFRQYQNKSIRIYDVPGSRRTNGLGLNDLGVRVGEYADAVSPHGFMLSGSGKLTTIDFPGADRTLVTGINKAGLAVGYYEAEEVDHGFLWEAGSFTVIDYPGALHTGLQAINNLGQAVGFYCIDLDNCHGFSYFQGSFESIDVPGATITRAFGVNDLGQVAGAFYTDQNYGFVATPKVTP